MKVFYALLLACTLFSCKKHSSSNPDLSQTNKPDTLSESLSFKFNGVNITGISIISIRDSILHIGGYSYATIPGLSDYSKNLIDIYVTMPSNKITIGQYYIGYNPNDNNSIIVQDNSNINQELSRSFYYSDYANKSKSILNINSYDSADRSIQCTFSGTLDLHENDSTQYKYTLLNGSIN
jgi:hypothetical protein